MKNYTSIQHNHRHKMIERDFIESVIVNTPELSYKYQIYVLKNSYPVKKHYRKTLSAAYKVQNKNIGE
mgnify:FL=1